MPAKWAHLIIRHHNRSNYIATLDLNYSHMYYQTRPKSTVICNEHWTSNG